MSASREAEAYAAILAELEGLRPRARRRARQGWRAEHLPSIGRWLRLPSVRALPAPVRRLLLLTWRRVSGRLHVAVARVVFTYLAARGAPASRSAVRFAARAVSLDTRAEAWPSLRAALVDNDLMAALLGWREQRRAAAARRERAAVGWEEVEGLLHDLLSVVGLPLERVDLVGTGEGGDAWSASTDGRRIRMSARLAVTEHRDLHRFAYVSMLLHEAAHIQLGSFDVDLRRVEAALEAAGERSAPQDGAGASGPPLHEMLVRRLGPDRAQTLAFIWNVVEDGRVEAYLDRRWPTLVPWRRAMRAVERRVGPHLELCDAEMRLSAAIVCMVLGDEHHLQIPSNLQAMWDALAPLLQIARSGRLADATETLLVALRIERTLRDPSLGGLVCPTLPPRHFRIEGIRLDGEDAPRERSSGSSLRVPKEDPRPKGLPTYPEYDVRSGWDRGDYVAVEEAPFVPTRAPWRPLSARLQAAFVGPHATRPSRPRGLRRRHTGLRADPNRLYHHHLAVRAGVVDCAPVFLGAIGRDPMRRHRVDFLIDLTVSMEKPLRGGSVPLQVALAAVRAAGAALHAGGYSVCVWGGWDFGPAALRLLRVIGPGDAWSTDAVARMHAVAPGGFRVGGFLRHLAVMRPGTTVVSVSDGGSGYVVDGLVHARPERGGECDGCDMRATCPVDPALPGVMSANGQVRVYHSSSYTAADVARARLKNPQIDAIAWIAADHPDAEGLDVAWGSQGWAPIVGRVATQRAFHGLMQRLTTTDAPSAPHLAGAWRLTERIADVDCEPERRHGRRSLEEES